MLEAITVPERTRVTDVTARTLSSLAKSLPNWSRPVVCKVNSIVTEPSSFSSVTTDAILTFSSDTITVVSRNRPTLS